MGFLMPKAPSVPPPPPVPPPAAPPTIANPQVAMSAAAQRQRAAGAGAFGGTVTTGPQGLVTPANTAMKTLLG